MFIGAHRRERSIPTATPLQLQDQKKAHTKKKIKFR